MQNIVCCRREIIQILLIIKADVSLTKITFWNEHQYNHSEITNFQVINTKHPVRSVGTTGVEEWIHGGADALHLPFTSLSVS